MAFPDDILDLKVELRYGGAWNDISSYIRAEDGVQIKRGRTDSNFDLDPSSCKMRLDNSDGRFSNRNPSSPLYGLAGRNAPLRVSIPADEVYLWSPGSVGDANVSDPDGVEEFYFPAASCPDAAALGVTGDIDVRVDADIWWTHDWGVLASKYESASDERSWILSAEHRGLLVFEWTTSGAVGTRTTVTSTEPVGKVKGRLAVRATLDADNGSSGNTVTFYTADSLSGSWTQLGDPVVTSGTTSIYDGTAPVEVAGGYARQVTQPRGYFYGFELYDGIDGTVVANPDFTAQSAGTTSFADTASSPNTWTIASSARIDDRDYRFHGEVASWPQAWDPSGTDVYVDITAYGIMRRLRHNEKALKSAMYRATTEDTSTVAYWPMEESNGAAQFASPLEGVAPMSFSRGANTKPDLAAFDEFDGSEPVPEFEDTYFAASVPPYRLASGTASEVRFLFNNEHDPTIERIATIRTTGTAREWRLFYATGGNLDIYAFDEDGTQILADTANLADLDSRPVRIGFRFGQSGSDVAYAALVADAESGDWNFWNGTLSSRSAGIIYEINFNPGGGLGDGTNHAALGHVSVHKDQDLPPLTVSTDVYQTRVVSAPPHGWKAEHAGRRFQRLCFEQGVPYSVLGAAWQTLTMSAQRPEPLSKLLADCATADEGLLVEPRDAFELAMRTRDTMVNPPAALTLDYSSSEPSPPFLPVEDDDDSVNDITAKSTNGSFARAVLTKGSLSVLDPPDGIGQYETEIERNAEYAEQMPHYAHTALRLGTLDAPRYPQVTVELARSAMASKRTAAKAVDIGDRIVVENLPDWLPPDDVKLRIEGINETLNAFEHTITYNCTPGEVQDFAVVGTDRYDSEHTYLRGPVDSDDTALEVVVRKGPLWASDTYNVTVGGEEMTVSAVAGSASSGVDVADGFDRIETSGWGTADTGNAWSTSGGSATDYTTDGATAAISVSAVNSGRYSVASQPHTDIDLRVDLRCPTTPATDATNGYLLARYTNTTNWYAATAGFAEDGNLYVALERVVGGSFAFVVSPTDTGITYDTGTWYTMRFRAIGDALSVKIWERGDPEPATWGLTATDSNLTSGTHVGCRAFIEPSSTLTPPVSMLFDNFDAATPQTMTVTRSVNGVTKSQVPDQQLHLAARPFRNFDRLPFTDDAVDWFTGEVLGNLRSPRTVQAESGTNIANIDSGTFALNSTSVVGVRFMAPLSGRVLITTAGIGRDNTNTNRCFLIPDIWRVKEDDNTWSNFFDGTSESSFRYGLAFDGDPVDPAGHSQTYMFGGFQPGQVYFARLLSAAETDTSASADILHRAITVEPAP